MLSDWDMAGVEDVFEAHSVEGNGYGWTGVAQSAVQSRAPDIADSIDFDPEAGTFVANSDDPVALQRLGKVLAAAFHDRALLEELIENGDPDWFD